MLTKVKQYLYEGKLLQQYRTENVKEINRSSKRNR